MISRVEITRNLNEINNLYNSARGIKKPNFFAKLAILEASRWIEECIDKIVLNISNSKLTLLPNKNTYLNEIVKKTSGFEYNRYIRDRLLRTLIGLILTEKIESVLNIDPLFVQMKASSVILSQHRNDNAHVFISGTTPSLIAPSVTIQLFNEIYEGLRVLNRELKKIKFK